MIDERRYKAYLLEADRLAQVGVISESYRETYKAALKHAYERSRAGEFSKKEEEIDSEGGRAGISMKPPKGARKGIGTANAKKKGERASTHLHIRAKESDKQLCYEAAKLSGKSSSKWIWETLTEKAREVINNKNK